MMPRRPESAMPASGVSAMLFNIVKTAALASMPSVSTATTVSVNAGALARTRTAYRTSVA
jgi:hypothetical protein